MKRLLKRVCASLWKSCGCARIVVLVDSVGMDQVNDALAFRRVHGNDKETHLDVLAVLTHDRPCERLVYELGLGRTVAWSGGAVLAGPPRAIRGAGGCIWRPGAALRTREEASSTSDPSELPWHWSQAAPNTPISLRL